MDESCLDFVPTRCSSLKNIAVKYQEVKFENRSKKKKQNSGVTLLLNEPTKESSDFNISGEEFDIKRAKYEIKKFAKSNVKLSDRHKSLRELAIDLGARPSRNKSTNYKDILAKKQKTKEKKLKMLDKIVKGKPMKRPWKKNTKDDGRNRNGILNVYGKATLQTNKRDGHMKQK